MENTNSIAARLESFLCSVARYSTPAPHVWPGNNGPVARKKRPCGQELSAVWPESAYVITTLELLTSSGLGLAYAWICIRQEEGEFTQRHEDVDLHTS